MHTSAHVAVIAPAPWTKAASDTVCQQLQASICHLVGDRTRAESEALVRESLSDVLVAPDQFTIEIIAIR